MEKDKKNEHLSVFEQIRPFLKDKSLGTKNKKHIMVLDGQENVSKLCLCGSPCLLCGSPRSHYCVCYVELHGEDAETRRGNNYKLIIFHSLMKFFIFIFFLFSCSGNHDKRTKTMLVQDIIDIPFLSAGKDADSLKMISVSFYNWYIQRGGGCYAALNEDSTVSLQNIDTYLMELKKLGTVSQKFINREKQRFEECNQFLAAGDWTNVNEYGDQYIYADSGEPCKWLAFDYWFQSQETSDEVEVSNLIIGNDTIIANIEFYARDGAEKTKQYYSAKEFLVREKSIWLIDSIFVFTH